MQENEFEKRVQEEMAEFRLRPSDSVWEKVEEQLEKKKRRRIVFFIFILAGLSLLGYTGYFFIKINAKQNLVQRDNNSLPNTGSSKNSDQLILPTTENPVVNEQPSIKNHELSQAKENDRENETVSRVDNEKVTVTGNDIAVNNKPTGKAINSDSYAIAKPAVKRDGEITKHIIPPAEVENSQRNRSLNDPVNIAGISQQDIAKNSLPDDSKITGEKSDDKTADQKINQPTKSDSVIITADSKAGEAIAATKKKQTGSKIKWGFDLSAGISSSRNNAFSLFDMQKSAADLQSLPPLNNSGGGLGSPPRTYPSDVKAGSAWRAGVVAEIEITKRSSIVSGLQYMYHSNSITVGAYTDTTVVVRNSFSQAARVDAIYRGTQQKEYTNRFHFIQIPVQYQLQINKGVKTPILWSVGFAAGFLLGTNGLVYDTAANGIYYRDNAAFNKFQFNLNTGLSFRFGNKNKVQWSLGPEFSLGLNRLMKDDYTKKQYLLYSGLTGRLLFPKKK